MAYQAGIAKRADVIAMFEAMDCDPGILDIVVNNSGVSTGGALADVTDRT